ncbi:MAG: 30S ribosomal protein S9 [Pseudomonadota bacterium]
MIDLNLETQETPTAPPPRAEVTPQDSVQPEIDQLGRSYATGRRKTSAARVWVKRGTGKIVCNGSDYRSYLGRAVLQMAVKRPLVVADCQDQFDVFATVKGGGLAGQAGAIRHGLARALVKFQPDLRGKFKTERLLTRDSRVVERKKFGRRKARRSFQFSKR